MPRTRALMVKYRHGQDFAAQLLFHRHGGDGNDLREFGLGGAAGRPAGNKRHAKSRPTCKRRAAPGFAPSFRVSVRSPGRVLPVGAPPSRRIGHHAFARTGQYDAHSKHHAGPRPPRATRGPADSANLRRKVLARARRLQPERQTGSLARAKNPLAIDVRSP
jgi:hypothetical protein